MLSGFVPGLRALYHEHDSPKAVPGRPASKFERLVLRMRRTAAQRTDLCLIPNDVRAKECKNETVSDRPVIRVWNCPSLEAVSESAPVRASQNLIGFFLDQLFRGVFRRRFWKLE